MRHRLPVVLSWILIDYSRRGLRCGRMSISDDPFYAVTGTQRVLTRVALENNACLGPWLNLGLFVRHLTNLG